MRLLTLLALLLPLAGRGQVVISQVYGGGGNTGATIKQDFIELFNRGTTPVDLSSYTLQYTSAAGTFSVAANTSFTQLSGIIQPGKYLLVQEAAGTGGTTNLMPDITGFIPLSGTAGKVALANNSTAVTATAGPNSTFSSNVVDFVGYNTTATSYEGANPVAALTNTTAAIRAGNGCTDGNNNGADFATGAPTPRNSATAAAPCSATATPAEINVKQGTTTYLTASTYSGFATTTIGSTDVKAFTIENLGGTILNIASIVATGDFSVTGTVPTTVAANGMATFNVTFTPSAAGTRTGTVTIASDDSDEASYVVNLSGEGQASVPNPEINVQVAGTDYLTASAYAFGSTQVGTPVTATFTVQNLSTTDALSVTAQGVTGSTGAGFSLSGTATPYVVAANSSATFTVTFSPTSTGAKTGVITIASNDQNEASYVINLTGTATAAPPTLTAATASSLLLGIPSVVVFTGTNFTSASVINYSGGTVSGFTFSSASSIRATLTPTATGAGTVSVTTATGTTATLPMAATTPPTADLFEPFESVFQSSYTTMPTALALSSGSVTILQALLGNDDPRNNSQSARIRGGGYVEFARTAGVGTVGFLAAPFNATDAAAFTLSYSIDGGTTFVPVAGTPTPAAFTGTSLTAYSYTLNQVGNVLVRIGTTNTNTGNNPRVNIDDVQLSNYTAPVACAAPSTPTFGNIQQTSAEVTVAPGPNGTGPFTVTATPTAGGPAITATGASPVSLTGLAAGTSYSVTATSNCNTGFSSPSQPSAAATLTTAGATPAPTLAVTQGSTSYPSNGTAYGFGNQTVGSTSAPVAFTLTNSGPDALTISGISATGDYAVSGTVPTTVAANGGTATVSVTFAPTATGTRTGTLVINSNATNAATYTVNLTGNGQAAPLADLVVSNTQAISGSYNNVTVTATGRATLSGTLTVAGTLLVQTGGVLTQNCQALNGAGNFTLQAGAGLVICDPAGITTTGATGAIQVTGTRSYSPGAAYVYNGTAAQVTGSGLPAQVGGLGVANAAGVTLSQAVAVSQQVTLQVGNLNTNGQGLTLLSSAAGTAFVVNSPTSVVNGTATVQRYIDNTNPVGYRHYAAPVSNTTLADVATAGFAPTFNTAYNTSPTPGTVTPFPTVFGYNQSRIATVNSTYGAFDKGWFSPVAADPMLPNRGYTVNAPNTALVDFVGTLNNGLQPSGPLARGTDAQAGWQFLGNPYPAPLDWSTVADAQRPGMDAAMYVFQSSGQYGGSYRSFANGVGGSPLIPMASGYFARVTTPGTAGAVNLTNDNRVTTAAAVPAFGRGTADVRPQLHLQLRGTAGLDEAYVYFEAGATAGLDPRYDAVKLANPSGLNLASVTGSEQLAINGLPTLGATALVVPLAVAVPQAGSYSFDAADVANLVGTTVTLVDALTGTRTVLATGSTYAFAVAGTSAAGRFSLEFRASGVLATQAAKALAAQTQLFPNPASTTFRVAMPLLRHKAAVAATLTNALGQTVLTRSLSAPAGQAIAADFDVRGLARGVYTLRLTMDGEQVVRKVVVE
ncbi:hypothetical protein BEN47_14520 [Hymenobacter lapidarius]|uniref:LTD domain-containing protein n=2 Tax=Hymenobacter lapidarius TaxID=1908237 RepID=A0A1G1T4K0_9BACT|nr:hypothetical protein BEN47_14520 [Hymenobacter lapidarius]